MFQAGKLGLNHSASGNKAFVNWWAATQRWVAELFSLARSSVGRFVKKKKPSNMEHIYHLRINAIDLREDTNQVNQLFSVVINNH